MDDGDHGATQAAADVLNFCRGIHLDDFAVSKQLCAADRQLQGGIVLSGAKTVEKDLLERMFFSL